MDDWFTEIREQVQKKAADMQTFIEPQVQKIAQKSFHCMSECYKEPAFSLQNAEVCANRCQYYFSQINETIKDHLTILEDSFQVCTEKCSFVVKDDDQHQKCFQRCAKTTEEDFKIAQNNLSQLLKTYYEIAVFANNEIK